MASSIPASARAELAPAAAPAKPAGRARRTRALALGGGAFVVLLVVIALAAPVIAPHDPVRQSLRARLAAPTLSAADGKAHVLGTDHLGRDVLSRMIHGARVSLLVGFAAVVVGGIVGATLGLLAGFRGGWTDTMIMTLADAQLAFPFILLAIGIIAVLGPSFPTLVVVIGLSGWVDYARVLRSQVLVLRSREFVDAILALGGAVPRIVARHILPNVLSTLVVTAADGEAALALLERESVNAVVSDVRMPKLDGFQLCRAIRRDARWARLPFIFYSSVFIGGPARDLGRDVGATAYLDAKDITPQPMAVELERLVERP